MDRCGLCPQRAVTAWWLATHRLERYLCGHHSRGREADMVLAGWQLVVDDREPVTA